MSNVIVLGGRNFGKHFGHESGALMSWFSVPIKEIPQSSPVPPAKRACNKKSVTQWRVLI